MVLVRRTKPLSSHVDLTAGVGCQKRFLFRHWRHHAPFGQLLRATQSEIANSENKSPKAVKTDVDGIGPAVAETRRDIRLCGGLENGPGQHG